METAIENHDANAARGQQVQVLALPEILAIFKIGDKSGKEEKCPIWLP